MEPMHKTKAADYPPEIYCKPNWVLPEPIIADILQECDAIWTHSGNVKKPHAELTSGKCSNGFFNCLKALKYLNLNTIFSYYLAYKIRQVIGDMVVNWVIGSPMAGITFSYAVAQWLKADIHLFTEKDPKDKDNMLWVREVIPEGDTVLQIEELITTSKTLNAVQHAVDRDNKYPVNWIPVIGVFVHRPEKLPITHYGDRKVVSLFEREVWSVDPPCLLCTKGSQRYRPKSNWAELTEN
jgi:orotate phosphoribosyltransferase